MRQVDKDKVAFVAKLVTRYHINFRPTVHFKCDTNEVELDSSTLHTAHGNFFVHKKVTFIRSDKVHLEVAVAKSHRLVMENHC